MMGAWARCWWLWILAILAASAATGAVLGAAAALVRAWLEGQ